MTSEPPVVWVSNLLAALRHYRAVLGRDPDHTSCGTRAAWRLDDGRTLAVEARPSCAGTSAVELTVTDVSGCAGRLVAAGIEHTLLTIGTITVLTVVDADDNVVVLLGVPAAGPQRPD